ncbi:hypothetical protein P152DRAFT_129840 [Eremomyces bilateralis CBS 781.70]|uniref:Nephrocystin 3-like N-terminal domain-containing protein n=1 Tax=Eremomyces bilateralis CBS 781.70 TaxID=1392243 RepID=A0A6G1GFI3_9PEZI|nr:uncharacterized protein P152DRAFT_129840 [Eremomyces bilateralis CBS 781.70]KAF1816610.1 hypothetical protein P152DRAFT_129840 [Eremomyces bilateralis CBS 781.70]
MVGLCFAPPAIPPFVHLRNSSFNPDELIWTALHSGDTLIALQTLLSSYEDGHRQPSCEALYKTFLQMILQVKEVWIVLDALDECNARTGSPSEGLLSWMKDFQSSYRKNVHLLVTSRQERDIESIISKFARMDDIIPIQSDLITDDIRAYVRRRVTKGDGLKRWYSEPDIQKNTPEGHKWTQGVRSVGSRTSQVLTAYPATVC